jgi:predicted kinase
MQLIILIGIPGCGKSTFYKERFFNTHLRISLDLLHTRNKERQFLDLAFSLQQRMVIDNTNVLKDERMRYLHQGKANRYEVIGYYFESTLAECIQRNENRTGKDRINKAGVIAKYTLLQPPTFDEGFDMLYVVKTDDDQFMIKPLTNEI